MVVEDTTLARVTAAILLAGSVGLAAFLARAWTRDRQNRKYLLVIGGYDVILLALWAGATLIDGGYGATYFPALVLTAPWSFLVMFLALKGPMGAFFTGGWFANFIENFFVFVVLCGGMNNLLLGFVVKRWFARESPARDG